MPAIIPPAGNGTGEYPSGQRGQTVNLLAYAFGGSNPSSPIFSFFRFPTSIITPLRTTHHEGAACSDRGPRSDRPPMPTRSSMVFLCTLALLVIGVVMVNSAGMTVTPVPDGIAGLEAVSPAATLDTMSIATSRPAALLVVSMLGFAVCAVLPVRRIAGALTPAAHAPIGYIYAALIAGSLLMLGLLALVYIPSIQREMNYSARWINLPVVGSLQPSEIAKWGMIPLLAWYAAAARPAHQVLPVRPLPRRRRDRRRRRVHRARRPRDGRPRRDRAVRHAHRRGRAHLAVPDLRRARRRGRLHRDHHQPLPRPTHPRSSSTPSPTRAGRVTT